MLTIKKYPVKGIYFGEKSRYVNGLLTINQRELMDFCLDNLQGYILKLHIASAGDNTRIIHITDTVKPAFKEEGSPFPGWLEGENYCGRGKLHQLEGMSVMQTYCGPDVQEGILDMAGPGSRYSILSNLNHLVLCVEAIPENIDKKQLAKDLKTIILRAALYTASLTKDTAPEQIEIIYIKEPKENLPKIGYAYFIQAQGPLRNVHIFGRDCTKMKPEILSPEQIIDGALVSGNYIIACQKNPTYFHQENPIITQLLKRQGTELNLGEIIVSTEASLLEEKKFNSRRIAEIAAEKGFQGILITQEGGGHADVDLMLTLEECEKRGIKAVILANEIAGPKGDLPPLVSSSALADAIVTTGNNDEIISLPAVEKVIGGSDILNGKFDPRGAMETSLGILYTATNQLGINAMKTIML